MKTSNYEQKLVKSGVVLKDNKVKSSMAKSLPVEKSTTTECGVNYQLLAVIY